MEREARLVSDALGERLVQLAFRVIGHAWPWPLRYTLAVGLTLLVALAKVLFPETGEERPGLLLTIPVAVSALLAGLGPALLATAGAVAVVVFFLPPAMAFTVAADVSPLGLMASLLEGLVIALLGAGLRSALLRSLDNVHRLEQLQRERSALVATVTHEFRNPLAALSSHLDLAARYLTREDFRHRLPRSLEVASAQVGRLLRLTEDLLVVANAGDSTLRVDTQAVDLGRAAEAAAARAAASDPERRIWSAPATTAVTVLGDRARLDQILDNLLKNATRYSPRRSAIELSVATDGARHLGVVRVRDQGQGVAAGERELIFGRFARGSAARGVDGSGIGLYVSRELAQRMGGRLLLEDSSARGSVFALELPLAPADLVPAVDGDGQLAMSATDVPTETAEERSGLSAGTARDT
jgi:signal transduction histidine kinase